jgi:hypothetical protein
MQSRLLLFLVAPLVGFGATGVDAIRFEPNRGQADPLTRFLARSRGSLVLVRDNGIAVRRSFAGVDSQFEVEFSDANTPVAWERLEPLPGATTYIIGNRPEFWLRDVPEFGRLVRRNLYDGIDLVLYGSGSDVEYDLALRAGADPGRIRMRFSGQKDLYIDNSGSLVAVLASGKAIHRKPAIFEIRPDGSRRSVEGAWRLEGGGCVGFTVQREDNSRPLVVDPVLVSGTLLGGSGEDHVVFADARSIIVGNTTSAGFAGGSLTQTRGTDIFFYFPNSQSTTIIGGSGDDVATCVVAGNLTLVGGYTNSRDFPVGTQYYGYGYPLAIQTQYGGGDWDGFVLGGTSSIPDFSTYLGGSGDDRVLGVVRLNYFGFAASGMTTSPDFPLANAWQSAPGGGTDGFLTVMNNQGLLSLSTYLGGSGDDSATALALSADGASLYVAGVTGSSDWSTPGSWSGSRNGSSDAFLLRASATDTTWLQVQPLQGVYFGGSGDDRFVALAAMPNGGVAAAGVTSSADLALPGAAQSTYGGGPSDAFVVRFSSDLHAVEQGTFLGGSGADEVTALAANSFDELAVAGWTSSADLATVGPLLSPCGKGPSDGLLAHLDSAGRIIDAGCYGGSGADRITSVLLDGAQGIYIGGDSDSLDLDLQNPAQAVNAGGTDGFYATFHTTPMIHAEGVTVGKDLTGALTAFLGDSENYIGTPLTATSSDPAQVLLGTLPDDPGNASATLATGYGSNGTRRFLAYCLTDNADVGVELSAPGYESRTVHVRCVPSGLYINPAPVTATSGQGVIAVLPAAFDPATLSLLAFQNPRGGMAPIDIGAASSNADFVTVSPASLTIDAYSDLSHPVSYPLATEFSFKTNGVGSADVTFSTSSPFLFLPSNAAHVRAAGPTLSIRVPTLARDVVAQVGVWLNRSDNSGGTVPVTLTTSDPSKVRLTLDPFQPGQESITFDSSGTNSGPFAWVEVLDPGSASITASTPGSDPVTVPVAYGTLQVGVAAASNTTLNPVPVLQNGTAGFLLKPYVSPPDRYGVSSLSYRYRVGAAPIRAEVASDAPDIASITPFAESLLLTSPTGDFLTSTFNVNGRQPGVARISAKVVSGSAIPAAPLAVDIKSPNLTIRGKAVGYNLVGQLDLSIPGKSDSEPTDIKVQVSDPTLALLSTDSNSPGQASLTLSTTYSGATVYLQALAGSGSVVVTASAGAYGSANVTIPLEPSGFAWSSKSFTVLSSGTIPQPVLFVLDPATLVPIGPQPVRPGITGSLQLEVSDTTVITLTTGSIPLASFGQPFTFNVVSPGTAQIAIRQPAGFVQPAGRGPLQVTVPRPTFGLQPAIIGRNTQASLTVNVSSGPVPTSLPAITVTSSDPSKLLLSTSGFSLGSGSVTLPPGSVTAFQLYMNAIDGPADVRVTAAADGFGTGSVVVPINSTALAFATQYSPLIASTQQGTLDLGLNPIAVDVTGSAISMAPSGLTLRPGLESIPVTVNSSNPDIATVTPNPILNSLTNSSRVSLKAIAPGEVDLTISPPPGYISAPAHSGRTAHVMVKGPSFVLSDVVLGQDMQIASYLSVLYGAGAIPADVDVTLTSADGSKVVLSADAGLPGVPSLIVHFARGDSPSRAIYVQALDKSGNVPVTITADSYQTSTARVLLHPATFRLSPTDVYTSPQNLPTTVALLPAPSWPELAGLGNYLWRPGLAPAISAISSNAAVATVTPAAIAWPSGARELDFKVQAVSPGTASLSFTVPDGYIAPSDARVTVTGGTLNLSLRTLALGRNLEDSIVIYGNPGQVTVTSSDPGRVLVWNSPAQVGQITTTVDAQATGNPRVYIQALADSGTATLTFSAAGYSDATVTVQLASTAVQLIAPSQIPTLTPLSAPILFQAKLVTYPNSSYASSAPVLRPGAGSVVVQPSLSDPATGVITPAQLTFNAGDSSQAFAVQPAAPGAALLKLSVPDGFGDPVALRQQLLTVVGARLLYSAPLSVGKELVRPNTVVLSTPAGKTTVITLTASDPSRLLLATAANPAGAASVDVTIPAGLTSAAFSLIGLDSTGAVTLSATTPGASAVSAVTLEPAGFIFGSVPSSAGVNASINISVQACALNPQTLKPDGTLPLRPGAGSVSVNITSSNTAAIPDLYPVHLSAGDASGFVYVTTKAAGAVTLTIHPPPGFTMPSAGATTGITVR